MEVLKRCDFCGEFKPNLKNFFSIVEMKFFLMCSECEDKGFNIEKLKGGLK